MYVVVAAITNRLKRASAALQVPGGALQGKLTCTQFSAEAQEDDQMQKGLGTLVKVDRGWGDGLV